MDHHDHVTLLRAGVPDPGGIWADIGSGRGAFTLALAELLGEQAEIHSIDRDGGALREQERLIQARFPQRSPDRTHYLRADFTKPLPLPSLDGIVAANSLHFIRQKEPVLALLRSYLRPGGRLVIVEYNVDRGNTWVPYPLSFPTWQKLAQACGFSETRLLATRPSRFLGEIYSAESRW